MTAGRAQGGCAGTGCCKNGGDQQDKSEIMTVRAPWLPAGTTQAWPHRAGHPYVLGAQLHEVPAAPQKLQPPSKLQHDRVRQH